MNITRQSSLVVLSNIEGLGSHLHSFFGESSPNISSFNSSITKMNLQEDSHNEIRKTLSDSEFFVADPSILSEILSFCSLDKIKWIHSTWAGPDKLIRQMKELGRERNVSKLPLLTRAAPKSSPMGWDLAEWCIGQIIARERKFYKSYDNQKESKWDKEPFMHYRSLRDLTIGVLGIGTIGKCVLITAGNFNMNVLGLCRTKDSSRKNELSKVQFYLQSELPELLSKCDYIINALPSTSETIGMFNGNMFENCKNGAVFINIGRGDICSEESLIHAIENKWISGAILDVLPKEPLPSESKLWKLPGVIITPHVGGVSFPSTVMESFKEEYSYIKENKTPPTAVNWNEEY